MLNLVGTNPYQKEGKEKPKAIPDDRPDEEKYAGLPTEWDWRNVNGVNYETPVWNQGNCGSCYAVAGVTSLAARFRVASKMKIQPKFSAQDVLSCSVYNQGCEGGYPFLVVKHAAEFGLINEECNFYQGRDIDCDMTQFQGRFKQREISDFKDKKSDDEVECAQKYYVQNYRYVGGYYGGCSEVAMMKEIYQGGPIVVAFEAPNSLYYYDGGIYAGPSPKKVDEHVKGLNPWEQTNHAVVCVGWGVALDGTKYWTIKNTWGKSWGEAGYFRIKRGEDICGIESMAVTADPVLPEGFEVDDPAAPAANAAPVAAPVAAKDDAKDAAVKDDAKDAAAKDADVSEDGDRELLLDSPEEAEKVVPVKDMVIPEFH